MKRIPEPELMIDDRQARAYAEANFETPHNHFIELLRQALPELPRKGLALDLGCGPGDITLRFARAFPTWSVHGVDGSAAMLRHGWKAVEESGLRDCVELIQAHLPKDDMPGEAYELILSNSLLHHLSDPADLWTTAKRWSVPEAHIFIMDLLRPESRTQALNLVEQHATGEPEVLREDFLHSLLAAYRIEEVQLQLEDAGLGHLSVRQVSDRHFIIWGRRW